MRDIRKQEVLQKKRYLGNGIAIKVLTTNKPGSPTYTTSEFLVCWDGEGSLEQLHAHTKKTNQKPTCSAPPSAKQIDTFLVDGERGQIIWGEYVKRRWGKNSPY